MVRPAATCPDKPCPPRRTRSKTGPQLGVCFAGVMFVLAATAAAQVPPAFVMEWGQFGLVNPGDFNEPFAIALGPNGEVYVSDTVNYRIQKFDASGNFLLQWGSFGTNPGQFMDPVGLTVDPSGNVYVAEWTGDRVQKFDSNGNFLLQWGGTGTGPGQFDTADDVCLDPSGNVFVVDKLNHRVQKFDSSGNFLLQWGGMGTADGQFQFPVGIACDGSGNVYVAEQVGNRIQKFDGNGTFLKKWGTPGSGPGQFNEPIHLDMDANDVLYVPDSQNHRIQAFDSDGNFLFEWGSMGSGPGEFNEPEGLAVDGNGLIYVADTHNHRVQVFGPGGCPDCPPLPVANTAWLRLGDPVDLGGNQFDLPFLAATPEAITFSQMTIEYDSLCMTFQTARVGADVASAGTLFINDRPGATEPTLNRTLTLNVNGQYGGACSLEVFVATFQSLVGPSIPCRIVWDRSTPGNPPNHLNTAGNVQIKSPNIAFCDVDSLDLRSTIFRVGPAEVVGSNVEVPLLVTTPDSISFSQLTIEYLGACLSFVGAAPGSSVSNPGSVFSNDTPGANDPNLDRHVISNFTGEYGPGVDLEVLRLTFTLQPGAPTPCRLVWDRSAPAGNPPNHLITKQPALIDPGQIRFIDGSVPGGACSNVQVTGTVTYYANGRVILPDIPDAGTPGVTVEDCNNTANATVAGTGGYALDFGSGPLGQVCICASRPKVLCNDAEGGVISGNDLILLEDFIASVRVPTPRQVLAGDTNGDALLLANDALALKQWIGKAAPCLGNTCLGQPTDNCTGTWRFVYPTGPGPSDFDEDMRCITNVCADTTIDIEGILVGDVDASWPNVFPAPLKSSAPVGLTLAIQNREADEVTLVLRAAPASGAVLEHVIYSLEYDPTALQYLEARVGDAVRGWGLFDNHAQLGAAHGIVHRPGGRPGSTRAGDVLTFRFRLRDPEGALSVSFTRLLANDRDAGDLAIDLGTGSDSIDRLPTRFTLGAHPNPFNPTTRVRFTIPRGSGDVPVRLRVYDIAGRLVRTLLDEPRGPGAHDVVWTGTGENGAPVGAGIYFLRIRAGSWTDVQKIALVK